MERTLDDLATGLRHLRRQAEYLAMPHDLEDPVKVRVGLGLNANLQVEDVWDVVDTAERVGLDSLWFAERLTGDQLAPLSTMAAVAGRTSRIRFGSSALILPGRDPVQLAKEIATIDRLSGGRCIPVLGLVSPHGPDRPLLRVPDGAAGRWADEALAVMRRLWAGECVDHRGEFFAYDGVRIGPTRTGPEPMDVWTGGASGFAVRRAGRFADGWLPSYLPADRYLDLATAVLTAAAQAGRGWDLGHFGMMLPYIPLGAHGRARPALAALATRLQAAGDPTVPPAAELADHVVSYVAAGASKFVAVPVVAPGDWTAEIEWLEQEVAQPLRALTIRP